MRAALCALVLAGAACRQAEPPPPAAEPAVEVPMDKNKVEKYVAGLQADVKRAQEAKEKADAANKKAQEANKLPE